MTFGILSISYKRPAILRLFCASIKRLREELQIFIPCVIVGDAEHRKICDEYHIAFFEMPNHPATDKWNKGVDYLLSQGVDYCCISGSDDIISTPLMSNLITEMEKGTDVIGVNSIYFYCAEGKHRGHMIKLTSTQMLGVCKTIHRRVIEQALPLWNVPKSWGMDSILTKRILPFVRTKKIVEGVVTDIKSKESLNHYTFWIQKIQVETPANVFYETLSEEELQVLIKIR